MPSQRSPPGWSPSRWPVVADPSQGLREATPGGASAREVLDRVLGKGVVIDDFTRVGLMGIDLLTGRARVIVTSAETHLDHESVVGATKAA